MRVGEKKLKNIQENARMALGHFRLMPFPTHSSDPIVSHPNILRRLRFYANPTGNFRLCTLNQLATTSFVGGIIQTRIVVGV